MFITLEGSEGSGKTTQAPLLAECLRGSGYDVLSLREPGGTPIGEQIRLVLNRLDNTDMHPRAEILLFQASRAQLVEQVIRPHLQKGGVVVCDRYADSTLAYQGYGYESDLEPLKNLIHFATGGLKPDLTFLLGVDVEEGLRRRASGGGWNRLDAYELAFYRRVRAGYFELALAEPERWVVVDANRGLAAVQKELQEKALERLQQQSQAG
jgi:dTMP kinase